MGTSAVVSSFDFTSLFAGEFPIRHRTLNLAAGQNAAPTVVNGALTATPLPRGTLLGRITTADTYTVCKTTATDGSQTPAAILASDTDTSGGVVSGSAYFEGEFAGEVMTIDPSWTLATLQTALRQVNSPLYVRSVGTLG